MFTAITDWFASFSPNVKDLESKLIATSEELTEARQLVEDYKNKLAACDEILWLDYGALQVKAAMSMIDCNGGKCTLVIKDNVPIVAVAPLSGYYTLAHPEIAQKVAPDGKIMGGNFFSYINGEITFSSQSGLCGPVNPFIWRTIRHEVAEAIIQQITCSESQ